MTTVATRALDIEVEPAFSSKSRQAFLRLPWRIYRNDPAWVPPLLLDREEFIDPSRHPFFRHGEAMPFIARQGGEVVGRVLASHDPRFNETHGMKAAAFGMFDCIDDEKVAHALLDAVTSFALERGCSRLWGPVDYSSNYSIGLLVDGFDTPPRLMMNHNPPEYAALLESYGLRKAKDLYAWWITDEMTPPERWRRIAAKVIEKKDVTIRSIEMRRFGEELERIKLVYNGAWEKNWGFVKMTDAEFDHLAKHLKRLAVPELISVAEVDGKPAGFAMGLPDINEALRHVPGGKLTTLGLPVGLARFLWHRSRVRTLRILTLGVLEPFRHRGLTELLILHTNDVGRQLGFNASEMSWTLEDNDLINKPIAALGATKYKTYRVYEKDLELPMKNAVAEC